MNPTNTPFLEAALKAKGIGPNGLRPLKTEQILGMVSEIADGAPLPLVTSILTGFAILEKDEAEWAALQEAWLDKLEGRCPLLDGLVLRRQVDSCFPHHQELNDLLGCRALSRLQCEKVMAFLLEPEADELVKVMLLQGLRVKRETDAENVALLDALQRTAPSRDVQADILVDWSVPYDGLNRNEDISLACAVLLAEMGLPVVLHAVRGLGPKYGKTILDFVSKDVVCDLEKACFSLDQSGVAIVDQAEVFPDLAALLPLRNAMRKRPCLATFEKMLLPLRAKRSILVTGYVHRAYRDSIPTMLKGVGVADEVLLFKGLEGSVILDPHKTQRVIQLKGGEVSEWKLPRLESEATELAQGDSTWWRCVEHPSRGRLLFTVGQVYERIVGGLVEGFTMDRMIQILDSGDFDNRLAMVREHYPHSEALSL